MIRVGYFTEDQFIEEITPPVGVALSDTFQAKDATLTAIAGLTWTAGSQIPTFTGVDVVAFRSVGVAAASDILDRAAGDGRYSVTAHTHPDVIAGGASGFMTGADKTKLNAITGTNTGDQTSIVGITGTIAQFNTALTDGDFATGGGTATGVNTGDQDLTPYALLTGAAFTGPVSTTSTLSVTGRATLGVITTSDDISQINVIGRYSAGFPSSYFDSSATSDGFRFRVGAGVEVFRIHAAGVDSAGGVKTSPSTVAGLPAVPAAGTRRFVTDATVTTFASIVVGGGANGVPVYSDGTNWRIG